MSEREPRQPFVEAAPEQKISWGSLRAEVAYEYLSRDPIKGAEELIRQDDIQTVERFFDAQGSTPALRVIQTAIACDYVETAKKWLHQSSTFAVGEFIYIPPEIRSDDYTALMDAAIEKIDIEHLSIENWTNAYIVGYIAQHRPEKIRDFMETVGIDLSNAVHIQFLTSILNQAPVYIEWAKKQVAPLFEGSITISPELSSFYLAYVKAFPEEYAFVLNIDFLFDTYEAFVFIDGLIKILPEKKQEILLHVQHSIDSKGIMVAEQLLYVLAQADSPDWLIAHLEDRKLSTDKLEYLIRELLDAGHVAAAQGLFQRSIPMPTINNLQQYKHYTLLEKLYTAGMVVPLDLASVPQLDFQKHFQFIIFLIKTGQIDSVLDRTDWSTFTVGVLGVPYFLEVCVQAGRSDILEKIHSIFEKIAQQPINIDDSERITTKQQRLYAKHRKHLSQGIEATFRRHDLTSPAAVSLEKELLAFVETMPDEYLFFAQNILNDEHILNPRVIRACELLSSGVVGAAVVPFKKTGSRLSLYIKRDKGNERPLITFVHDIKSQSAAAWDRLFNDGLPVAPIVHESRVSDQVTRVYSAFCGSSLASIYREQLLTLEQLKPLVAQQQMLVLRAQMSGIVHGHPHFGNVTLEFIAVDWLKGNPGVNINTVPRFGSEEVVMYDLGRYAADQSKWAPVVRLIDFDQAADVSHIA